MPVFLGQGVQDEMVVALPVGRTCQVGPPGMQHGEVVGVGQGPGPVVAGGQFGVFTVQAASTATGSRTSSSGCSAGSGSSPARSRSIRSRRASSGSGRVPGFGSASFGWMATVAPPVFLTPSWVMATTVLSSMPRVIATYSHSRGSRPVTSAEPPRTVPPMPLCPVTAYPRSVTVRSLDSPQKKA
jgi:hypothetical protein